MTSPKKQRKNRGRRKPSRGGLSIQEARVSIEKSIPRWAWPGLMRLGRESKIPELPLDLRNAFAPFLNQGKKVDRSGASRHDKVLRFQQRLVIEAREDSEEVHEEIVGQTRDLIKELYSDEPARLAQWESPRLCRGGLHSLTVPEIDETPSREPLKASRERVNCRTTERYSTQSGSVNITSSSSRSIVGRCSTGSCESTWARSSEGSHDRRSARLRKVI